MPAESRDSRLESQTLLL